MQRFAAAELCLELGAGVLHERAARERALELARGLLEVVQRQRPPARLQRVVDGLARRGDLRGLEVVVRERRDALALVGGREPLERARDGSVEGDAPLGLETRVERLAQQRVRETPAPQRAGHRAHEAEPERWSQRRDQLRRSLRERRGERVQLELAPEDGGELERAQRVGRHGLDPPPHQLAHAARDPALRGAHQERHLDHEVRVALGDRHDLRDGGLLELALEVVAEQRAHVGRLEPGQRLRPAQAAERYERAQPFGILARLVGAGRRDQQDPRRLELARDELEQAERPDVGPVEVVDHEHQRPGLRERGERRAHPLEELEARAGRLGVRAAVAGAQLRGELGQTRAAERLREGPVDRRALAVVAAAPRDVGPALARGGSERRGDARLADAGLAEHDDQPARARKGGLQLSPQSRELALAADQAGPVRHRHPLHSC